MRGTWLTDADARAACRVQAGSADEARALKARDGVAAWIEKQRTDLVVDADTFTADDDIVEGAKLLVARLYARNGSPLGTVGYGEFGVAAVVKYDSDAERLLGIGRYGAPVVG